MNNNCILEGMEKSGRELIEVIRENDNLNDMLEDQKTWVVQKDSDLRKLIARLFVQNVKEFDYTNNNEINRVKTVIKDIVEEHKEKMLCIMVAQKELGVTFNLSQYPGH